MIAATKECVLFLCGFVCIVYGAVVCVCVCTRLSTLLFRAKEVFGPLACLCKDKTRTSSTSIKAKVIFMKAKKIHVWVNHALTF